MTGIICEDKVPGGTRFLVDGYKALMLCIHGDDFGAIDFL